MTAPEFQAAAANVSSLPKRRAALDLALGARQFWRMAGLSLEEPAAPKQSLFALADGSRLEADYQISRLQTFNAGDKPPQVGP